MNSIALVLGGGADVLAECEAATAICKALDLPITYFVINDMIPIFPGECQAVTLHPEKLHRWLALRVANGHPPPSRVWAHNIRIKEVTDYVFDWAGSSGLVGVAVPRILGLTHIVLCGIPMTAAKHFVSGEPWEAVNSYRGIWEKLIPLLPPECVRSMSGWTREVFGPPEPEWLTSEIVVPPITRRPPVMLTA